MKYPELSLVPNAPRAAQLNREQALGVLSQILTDLDEQGQLATKLIRCSFQFRESSGTHAPKSRGWLPRLVAHDE